MAVAAIAALSGLIGAKVAQANSKPAAAATPVVAADQQNGAGAGSQANAKKYLLSQNPSAGYGSNSMNTAKSFLLSY